MPPGLNRALQVRTSDRLRAGLAQDELTALPVMSGLTEENQRELCDVGGGRLGAVAIKVEALVIEGVTEFEPRNRLGMREAARLIDEQIRRTDLLGTLSANTLLLLAPGLEPVAGRSLAARLSELLAHYRVEIGGAQVELRASVGVAYRSAISPGGWAARALAAEAELHAAEADLQAAESNLNQSEPLAAFG